MNATDAEQMGDTGKVRGYSLVYVEGKRSRRPDDENFQVWRNRKVSGHCDLFEVDDVSSHGTSINRCDVTTTLNDPAEGKKSVYKFCNWVAVSSS